MGAGVRDGPLRDAGEREQAGASWAGVWAGAEPCWLPGSGRAGKGGERVGPDLGVGLGFGFGFLSFFISFVFLTQTTQLFEFKNKFEFNPITQTNKRDAPA